MKIEGPKFSNRIRDQLPNNESARCLFFSISPVLINSFVAG